MRIKVGVQLDSGRDSWKAGRKDGDGLKRLFGLTDNNQLTSFGSIFNIDGYVMQAIG